MLSAYEAYTGSRADSMGRWATSYFLTQNTRFVDRNMRTGESSLKILTSTTDKIST